jgi:PAS domain S-box-containing protein
MTSVELAIGQLVWSLQDAAILVEATSGCILLWNPAAEALFGYSATEAGARAIDSIIHGATTRGAGPVETLAKRKDGEELWIELSVSPLAGETADYQYLLVIVRDATYRSRFRQQRAKVAALGADVGSAITSSGSMQEVLRRIASAVDAHLNMAATRIWILNASESTLDLLASAGLPADPADACNGVQIGGGRIGRIASERRVHITNSPLDDPQLENRDWLEREAVAAFAGFPLVVDDRIVGVLGMFSCGPIEPRMLDGLPGVLDPIGQYIVRKRAEDALRKSAALLEHRVGDRTRELVAVLELARDLASTLELGPLLNLILDRLQLLVPYTGAGILVVDGDRLYQRAHRSALPPAEGLRVTYSIDGWRDAWDQLTAGQPILICDTHAASGPAEIWRTLVDTPEQASYRNTIRTCMWAPLLVRDRLIGVLAVTSDEVNAFTAHQAELAAAAASHAAFAIENARLYEAARGTAALQERQRLARELHDSVSQVLYAIALSAAAARQLQGIDPARATGMLNEVYQLAQAGLAEMRALIFELRPESVEHDGLVCALERQAAALEARHRLPVTRRLCAEPAVPVPVKEVVYRVAQEALHNAAKHAQAGHLELLLNVAPAQLELCVGDDGRGFVPDSPFPGHLGLRSMRERAAVVGGELEIASAPGTGTTVCLRVPFGESRAAL